MNVNPKSILFLILFFNAFSFIYAQENSTNKAPKLAIDSTSVYKQHKVTFNIDFVNRYLWRGQSWGGDYAVIQPTLEYNPTNKLTFGIWATSNFKSDYFYEDGETSYKGYQEIDLYVCYKITKYLSAAIWDYYWPSVSKVEGVNNSFFNYGTNSSKTLVTELNFDFTELKLPLQTTISTFISGNDFKYDENGENPKQNYTTYIEIGYLVNTFKEIELNPIIGAVLNNQAEYYTSGDYNKVSFINLGIKASRNFQLGHSFEMIPFINYIHNSTTKNTEVFGKNFLTFGISFSRT